METIITKDDLLAYTAKVKPPLTVQLMNGQYQVHSPTAPSSGSVLQYIMNILDGKN